MNSKQPNVPTILIIFGATGDLMAKKIAPALFHLFEKQRLPQLFKIIGVARRNISNEDFQNNILQIITQHLDSQRERNKLSSFLQLFSYSQGKFENKSDYQQLATTLGRIDGHWQVCSNKLFYLAVPPQYYETIFKNLAATELTKPCSEEEGWTRVLVEKPFGKDLKTSQELDKLLATLFKEEQIYRIDHYLAKEMLQNILVFRFSNNLFETNWNNQSIEKIEIKLWETIGVEDRGSFYDGIGALRDVGQNHLLQILALMTMEHPVSFEVEVIRKNRSGTLKQLSTFSKKEIISSTFRAQYEGYRSIQGVDKNSATETYFKIKTNLHSPRWLGVPIVMEGGKRLHEARKEVIVTFKHPTPCLCPPGITEHYKNQVVFSLEPKEGITILFWSKKEGLEFEIDERTFDFLYRNKEKKSQYVEEYEKLLLDCIVGDQTLFVSTEEVKQMWQFIDPVVKAWEQNLVPLKNYQPDTDRAIIESAFIEED